MEEVNKKKRWKILIYIPAMYFTLFMLTRYFQHHLFISEIFLLNPKSTEFLVTIGNFHSVLQISFDSFRENRA